MTCDFRSVSGQYMDAGNPEADSLKHIPLPRHHLESTEVLPRHQISQIDNSEPREPWDQSILLKNGIYIF